MVGQAGIASLLSLEMMALAYGRYSLQPATTVKGSILESSAPQGKLGGPAGRRYYFSSCRPPRVSDVTVFPSSSTLFRTRWETTTTSHSSPPHHESLVIVIVIVKSFFPRRPTRSESGRTQRGGWGQGGQIQPFNSHIQKAIL